MTDTTPMYNDSPFFGYDVETIQQQYASRQAPGVADFFTPHLKSGMSILDCGCGPGTITQGLAHIVAPGQAVGCDLEPGMIEMAQSLTASSGIQNLRFQVGDILNLPFEDDTFDAAFSSAVTEHLSDPVRALSELRRVVKPGGLVGVTRTDWTYTIVSPPCDAFDRFFELFERGFHRRGGSMCSGRQLGDMMRDAGLTMVSMIAAWSNASTPDAAAQMAGGWAEWIENLPLFDESIALGETSRSELDATAAAMREWATQPGAFCASAGCRAIARKD